MHLCRLTRNVQQILALLQSAEDLYAKPAKVMTTVCLRLIAEWVNPTKLKCTQMPQHLVPTLSTGTYL